MFALDDRPVVLVFGGSSGARRLNNAMLGAQGSLAAMGVQVLLVAGREQAAAVAAQADASVITVVPYIERMDLAYSAACPMNTLNTLGVSQQIGTYLSATGGRADPGALPVRALMIESNLVGGRQNAPIIYGQSITDACISWETTERMLRSGYEALAALK